MARRAKGTQKPWLMKRYRSRAKVDTSKAPRWWPSSPAQVERRLRAMPGVEVFEIGRSAGGRSILAAAWGPRQRVRGRTSASLAAAISGGSAEAFYGQRKGRRQVFLFLGAAHGTEIEGTVAAINFLNVVVTGKDLRGRRWPEMAAAGRKLRIVIVPFLNVDGRSRFAERLHFIGVDPEAYRSMSQGNFADGRKLQWPTSKLHQPVPLEKVAQPLGSYFNDNGYNLVYDAGFGDGCQGETQALIDLLIREMPDCVLLSHSNNGSLVQPPCSFIPRHFRQRQLQVSSLVGSRCRRQGASKFPVPTRTEGYAGQVFYQSDMVYHVCGALPLLVEFPWGYRNNPDGHGEILDIGMYVLEEVVRFGTAYGFRPPEPRGPDDG